MRPKLTLTLGAETRTVSDLPTSLQELKAVAARLYALSSFSLRYKDQDSDWISLVEEREWEFAMKSLTSAVIEVEIVQKKQESHEERKDFPEKQSIPAVSLDFLLPKVQALLQTKPKKDLREGLIRNLVRTEVYLHQNLPVPAVHINVKCDGCKEFPLFGVRYRCCICRNYDLCEVCESKATHRHEMIKIAKPITEDPEAVQSSALMAKPEMTFIQHNNLHPGCEIKPGTELVKEWKVQNNGVSRWPADVLITHKSGELVSSPTEVISLKPGEQGSARVQVKVPNRPGVYTGKYVLMAQGEPFGEELTMMVKAAAYRYSDQLSQLMNMGFDDTDRLKSLLEQHKGRLEEVLNRLF